MNCQRCFPGLAEVHAAVLAASPDIVIVANGDGVVGQTNPAADRLLGTAPRRSMLEFVHPADHEVVLDTLAAGQLAFDPSPTPSPIRAAGADGRWVALEAVGVEPVGTGSSTWTVLVLRDVSGAETGHRLGGTRADLDDATSRDGPYRNENERRRLAADVERGLAADELALHYQPIRDVRSGRIAGFEGLLRWNHPDEGVIAAAEFLPAVEGTSTIEEIGEFVLTRGCAQLARWQAHFGDGAPTLALNISARQLRRGDFAGRVAQELAAAAVSAEGLCFELTETHALEREPRAVAEIRALRRLGAKVALDDFGTGYSSLHHLQEIGADVLKIDRSFIAKLGTDAGATAIVRSAIELGAAFGMVTIAEGVTTIEQHRRLLALGCDRIQGFLIAPALPPDLAEALLAAEPADDATVGAVDVEQRLTVLKAYGELADIDAGYRPSEEEVAAIAGVTALEARRGMTLRQRWDPGPHGHFADLGVAGA